MFRIVKEEMTVKHGFWFQCTLGKFKKSAGKFQLEESWKFVKKIGILKNLDTLLLYIRVRTDHENGDLRSDQDHLIEKWFKIRSDHFLNMIWSDLKWSEMILRSFPIIYYRKIKFFSCVFLKLHISIIAPVFNYIWYPLEPNGRVPRTILTSIILLHLNEWWHVKNNSNNSYFF